MAPTNPQPKRNLLAKALSIGLPAQRGVGASSQGKRQKPCGKSADLARHSALAAPAEMDECHGSLTGIRRVDKTDGRWHTANTTTQINKTKTGILTGRASATGLIRQAIAAAALPLALLIQPSAHAGEGAPQIPVTIGGNSYMITYSEFSYNLNPEKFNTSSMPWWGDSSLASQFATAVSGQLGAPLNGEVGPLFGWEKVDFYGDFGEIDSAIAACAWIRYIYTATRKEAALNRGEIVDCGGRADVRAALPYAFLAGITAGNIANATNPYSTTFAGGTLLVDAPGTYSQNWLLLNVPGNSIDLGGVGSTFSGIFSGPGGITFINSGQGGRLALSGINTYAGPTTVAAGANLAVNGSIASSSGLTVLGGGRIGGNGQLPGTTIAPRGFLAPGNSIGTLTVNGDFALQDGIYELELQGPQNDSVAVTGNVTAFSGTVRLLPFGGGSAFPDFTYIGLSAPNSNGFANAGSLTLDASGLPPSVVLASGTTLVQNSSGNPRQFDVQFRPRDPAGAVTAAIKATGAGNSNTLQGAKVFDNAFQRLASANAGNANASGSPIGSTGFTTNQAAAAGITPGFLQVQASLLALTTPEQLNAAVQSIAPENYAAFQAVALNTLQSQRELLFSQADSCPTNGWMVADATTGKKPRQPICVFATGGNTTASITGSNGLSSYNSAVAGGLYGLEWKTAPAWTIGAAYGYGTSNLSNLGEAANSVHSVVNSGSLYGVYKPANNWTIKGLFAYSNFNIDGQRNTPYLSNGNPITGNTTGQGFTTGLRAEMNLPLGSATSSLPLSLKPMVGLAYGAYQQGSFNEAGNDSLQLAVNQHTAQSLVGSLGAELSSRIILDAKANNAFVPKLTLAYQVDALANDSSNYSLDANLPAAGSGFTTIGQSYGANNLLVGGSMEVQIANKAAFYAGVNYQVFNSGNQFSYGGGLKYLF